MYQYITFDISAVWALKNLPKLKAIENTLISPTLFVASGFNT